jgi:hypothetical protein
LPLEFDVDQEKALEELKEENLHMNINSETTVYTRYLSFSANIPVLSLLMKNK